MPYQQYSEKLMSLDREEEAKRIMGGGYNQQYEADMQYANQGFGGAGDGQSPFQPSMPDMNNIAQPKARKMAAAKPAEDDDEGWGDAGALLD